VDERSNRNAALRSHPTGESWPDCTGQADAGVRPVIPPAPDRARQLAAALELRFAQDAELAASSTTRTSAFSTPTLGFGANCTPTAWPPSTASIPPPSMPQPPRTAPRFSAHRTRYRPSQHVQWQIHQAPCDHLRVAERRRRVAAGIGEDQLQLPRPPGRAGWSEQAPHNANSHELASSEHAV
jgi:hypothetical protein